MSTTEILAKQLFDKVIEDFFKSLNSWKRSNKNFSYDDVNSLFKTVYVRNYKTLIGASSYVSFGRGMVFTITYNRDIIVKIQAYLPDHILQKSLQIRDIHKIFNETNPCDLHQKYSFEKQYPTELDQISLESINNFKF